MAWRVDGSANGQNLTFWAGVRCSRGADGPPLNLDTASDLAGRAKPRADLRRSGVRGNQCSADQVPKETGRRGERATAERTTIVEHPIRMISVSPLTRAVSLWVVDRPASRTSAVAPLYSPSNRPNCA